MKLRLDFVSNSSSSSFIIHDSIELFKTFNITHQDIYETIHELMGIEKDSIIPYDSNKVWELYDGPPVVVYDLQNKDLKQSIYQEYQYMKEWIPRQQHGWECWNHLEQCLNLASITDREDGRYTVNNYNLKNPIEVPGLESFINFIRAYEEIYNMLDFLKMDDTTHLIHFQDNEIMRIKGFQEIPKEDWLSNYEKDNKEDLEASKTSKWESETGSPERFWNILLLKFVEMSKMDFNNPILRKHIQDEANWIKPDSIIDWDCVQNFLGWEAVLHEG